MSPETKESSNPLGRFYLEQHDRLFRAAYRVTGNATDAEDVVQTVFLRVAQRESGASGADNVPAYLYRAAINTALDLLRARREGQLVPLEDNNEQRQVNGNSDHGADDGLRKSLRAALSRLSPRWAEMVVLKHVEGCDNGEIARLCGTSEAVVAVTLFRARLRLKTELAEEIGGTP